MNNALVVVVLVMAAVLIGCVAPTPTPTVRPSPTPTPDVSCNYLGPTLIECDKADRRVLGIETSKSTSSVDRPIDLKLFADSAVAGNRPSLMALWRFRTLSEEAYSTETLFIGTIRPDMETSLSWTPRSAGEYFLFIEPPGNKRPWRTVEVEVGNVPSLTLAVSSISLRVGEQLSITGTLSDGFGNTPVNVYIRDARNTIVETLELATSGQGHLSAKWIPKRAGVFQVNGRSSSEWGWRQPALFGSVPVGSKEIQFYTAAESPVIQIQVSE